MSEARRHRMLVLGALFIGACGAPQLPAPVQPLAATTDEAFRHAIPASITRELPALPKVTTTTLASGLRVLVAEDHAQPVVLVRYVTRGGEHANQLFPGLVAWTFQLVVGPLINAMNADSQSDRPALTAGMDWDGQWLESRVSRDRLPAGLAAMHAVIHARVPSVDAAALRERARLLFTERQQTPAALAADLLLERLFDPRDRLSESLLGNVPHVNAITAQDVATEFAQLFRLERSAVIISGDVDPSSVVAAVERVFGTANPMREPEPPAPHDRAVVENGVSAIQVANTGFMPVAILAAQHGPARGAADSSAFALLTELLGGGQAGRLAQVLREESSLSYAPFASYHTMRNCGVLWLSTDVQDREIKPTLQRLRRVLHSFETAPEEADFVRTRRLYWQTRRAELETPRGMLGQLTQLFELDLGPALLQRELDELEALSVADVLAVARKYLHAQTLSIQVAGPVRLIAPQVQWLGDSPSYMDHPNPYRF